MNVDIGGVYVFIERLPLENDAQLRDRKDWVVSRILRFGDPMRAIQLSQYYHQVKYNHTTFSADIHREIGLYATHPPAADDLVSSKNL